MKLRFLIWLDLCNWSKRRREKESPMETAMTAAANIEIFLASLGLAALLAFGALRVAFRLMVNAGAGAGRHYTVRQAPPSGELALARADGMQRQVRHGIR
jgi:hypothetical protein